MNIIKKGNLPEYLKKTIRFTCDYCGCVFDAEAGEYEYVGITEALFVRNKHWHKYKCDHCPTCNHPVYNDEPMEEVIEDAYHQ